MRRIFLAVSDFLLRHRIQISAVFVFVGCFLAGVPIPLPTGGMLALPVPFPDLVPLGHALAGLGAMGGGVALITRWLRLMPDQAQKLERAVKDAAKTGEVQVVETRPGLPNVQVTPVKD